VESQGWTPNPHVDRSLGVVGHVRRQRALDLTLRSKDAAPLNQRAYLAMLVTVVTIPVPAPISTFAIAPLGTGCGASARWPVRHRQYILQAAKGCPLPLPLPTSRSPIKLK
jgi:hypothetical protein